MRVEKYQYQNFDEAEAALASMRAAKAAEEDEKLQPSPALIEEIRRQYYDSGYAQGMHDGAEHGRNNTLEEASKQAEAAIRSAVDAAVTSHHKQMEVTLGLVTQELGLGLERLAAETENERNTIATLAIAIARKIAGAALAAYPLEQVKAHVMSCLKELRNAPSVIIEVAPALRDMVASSCSDFAAMAGYRGILSVAANGELSGSDCRVIWQHGMSEMAQEKILQEITAVLTRHGFDKENGE